MYLSFFSHFILTTMTEPGRIQFEFCRVYEKKKTTMIFYAWFLSSYRPTKAFRSCSFFVTSGKSHSVTRQNYLSFRGKRLIACRDDAINVQISKRKKKMTVESWAFSIVFCSSRKSLLGLLQVKKGKTTLLIGTLVRGPIERNCALRASSS